MDGVRCTHRVQTAERPKDSHEPFKIVFGSLNSNYLHDDYPSLAEESGEVFVHAVGGSTAASSAKAGVRSLGNQNANESFPAGGYDTHLHAFIP